MDVPVLRTERLILRAHEGRDFGDCLAMWSDPEVVRHITGRPSTAEEVWSRLLRYVGHWSLMGFGYWVVEEAMTGRFAGEAGFADFRREIDPPFDKTPEAGWALQPWAQGKGLATEAMQAALAWADGSLPGGRTVCMVSPDNLASVRVAEKCGYRRYAVTAYRDEPTILFERSRPAG